MRGKSKSAARGKAAPESAPAWSQSGVTELILSQWRTEKPEIGGRGFQIGALLTRLNILLAQLEVSPSRGLGLRPGEIRLLYALRRVGPPYTQRPTDLFRLLGVTSGAITYTVSLLKAQGLVEGINDTDDGRSQLVRLTNKGLGLIDAVVDETARLLDVAVGWLPPDELATIQHGLSRLAAALEAFTDHRGNPPASKIEDEAG